MGIINTVQTSKNEFYPRLSEQNLTDFLILLSCRLKSPAYLMFFDKEVLILLYNDKHSNDYDFMFDIM